MEFSWENVLHKIRKNVSKPSYETWFKYTSAEIGENTLTIFSPNAFAKDWLENHYGDMILTIIQDITGKAYALHFAIKQFEENVNIQNSTSNYDSTYELTHNQNTLLKSQQEKIEELEKRIQILEQKLGL